MKFFVILLVSALVTLALVGCVQARVGSPEYTDPYGFNPEYPDKRWWGEDRPVRDVDIDKFLYRWKGLTK